MKTYLANYDQAICLCPPDRCPGCVRADVNDTKPRKSSECAYNCPVSQTLKRIERNAQKRAENQILRDLCGTSARAARADMGL